MRTIQALSRIDKISRRWRNGSLRQRYSTDGLKEKMKRFLTRSIVLSPSRWSTRSAAASCMPGLQKGALTFFVFVFFTYSQKRKISVYQTLEDSFSVISNSILQANSHSNAATCVQDLQDSRTLFPLKNTSVSPKCWPNLANLSNCMKLSQM